MGASVDLIISQSKGKMGYGIHNVAMVTQIIVKRSVFLNFHPSLERQLRSNFCPIDSCGVLAAKS